MGDIQGEGPVLSISAAGSLDELYGNDPALANRVDDLLDEIEDQIADDDAHFQVFDGPDGIRYSRKIATVGRSSAVVVWSARHPQRVVAIEKLPDGLI
jgi:hypothetical protein